MKRSTSAVVANRFGLTRRPRTSALSQWQGPPTQFFDGQHLSCQQHGVADVEHPRFLGDCARRCANELLGIGDGKWRPDLSDRHPF